MHKNNLQVPVEVFSRVYLRFPSGWAALFLAFSFPSSLACHERMDVGPWNHTCPFYSRGCSPIGGWGIGGANQGKRHDFEMQ